MSVRSLSRLEHHVAQIDALMLAELRQWPWTFAAPLHRLIDAQLRQPGKRLRPLLALAITRMLGGQPERVYPGAAGVEFYHLASLILDDVEDNSDSRRGLHTIHTTAGTSTAINTAATIRSLAYHPIHRSPLLEPVEKLEMHRRLDIAATHLVIGQSIDIGWHAGWFQTPHAFPYDQMASWKTGALFAASASIAAIACGADHDLTERFAALGATFGWLYQMVDDAQDMFPTPGVADEDAGAEVPVSLDLAQGKPTYPLLVLLNLLSGADRSRAVLILQSAVQRTGQTGLAPDDRVWLACRMRDLQVHDIVEGHIRRAAVELVDQFAALDGDAAAEPVAELVDLILVPLARPAGHPARAHNAMEIP
jgi:octaprenyl-diphosphate synthase